MSTSVEDAIRLQKFRLLSFVAQKFESGNIELAHEALNGVEYYANEAITWLESLSEVSKSKLTALGAKLEEIKKKVNQWREILSDIWGNRKKLGQVINELAEESNSISVFSQQISDLRGEIAAKVKESQTAKQEELVKELKRLYNLREKIEWLKASLGVAKSRLEVIKEEIRAKKKR